MVGRKRQKGGFLPIFGTLAKPLLVSAVGTVGGAVLKRIGKKCFGEENVVEKEERKDIDMPRNNILLQRLPNPRRIQPPNGRFFFAKYQRVNRHALALTQVRIARTYVLKIGPKRQRIKRLGPRNKGKRRQQAGTGLNLATAVDLGKRLQV